MRSRDIEMWVDERLYNALQHQLKDQTVENKLLEHFDQLASSMIPKDEYASIVQEIEQERIMSEKEAEANRRFSVFFVTENGKDKSFLVEGQEDFLSAAWTLRHHLKNTKTRQSDFSGCYPKAQEISPKEFVQYVKDKFEGDARVVGAFDIDLDSNEFSVLREGRGWQTYSVNDVSVAAYRAYQKQVTTYKTKLERFQAHLADKGMLSETAPLLADGIRKLQPDDISFSDEIQYMEHLLNFYMDSFSGEDEVFGTHVDTDENDDYINIYADYDLERDALCDELEVTLWKDDSSFVYHYKLIEAERKMVMEKMEAYCFLMMGKTLKECAAEYRAEMAGEESAQQQPSM